jgi:hypothetical protein
MLCKKHQYFVLFRGDSSDFPWNQELIVEINTTRDLTGCSAHFQFQDYRIDFDTIPSDKKLHLVFPATETKKFTLGAADAKLWLTYDSGDNEKVRTIDNRIHIVVTNNIGEAYDNYDPQAITVTISGDGWHPFTDNDVFDMECNDWEFRKVVAKVWEILGGKVLNND